MIKYDTYKDSGSEWLQDVPKHWQSNRLDWLGVIVRGNTGFKKDELLNKGEYVALQYGKTYKVDEVNNEFNYYVNSNFYKESQVVNYGDVILISTSETLEDIGHSCFYNRTDIGLLGGEQLLFIPNRKLTNEKYLYYYSKIFRRELKRFAKGLKVYRFNSNDLKKVFIALPPIKEQTQIANYLDKKTNGIDRKIELLSKKISTYKELRKSIINETVTKGLDKNAVLKDSSIEWIGKIPEHWEVVRIKDKFNTLAGGTPSTKEKSYWSGTIPWIPSGAVQNCDINENIIKSYISEEALLKTSTKMAFKNSVLIALTGATCSNIGYLNFDTTINQSIVAIYKKYDNIIHRYYYYYLTSAKEKIRTLMTGGAQGGINQGDVKFLNIVSPTFSEQKAIAKYLDEKTSKIDAIVNNIENQITHLKELRKALINDVVTGKIKVVK